VCGSVRQCVAICGSMRQCEALRQCAAVRAAVCGSAHCGVQMYVCMYIALRAAVCKCL
jgi:hypothetical protein